LKPRLREGTRQGRERGTVKAERESLSQGLERGVQSRDRVKAKRERDR
jgi:hypothetical protein